MKGRILTNVSGSAVARAVTWAAFSALAVGAGLAIAATGPASAGAKTAPPAPPTAAERAITYRKAMYQVMYNNFAPVGGMASGKIPYDAKAHFHAQIQFLASTFRVRSACRGSRRST